MDEPEPRSDGCWDASCSALTVDDVYDIAKAIGTDVERLVDSCGKDSVAALVGKTVKVLELLESFASRNDAHKLREDQLLRTFETIQLQQKRRLGKEAEEGSESHEELQQTEQQWRRRCEELQIQVRQLQEDKNELHDQLKGNHAQEGRGHQHPPRDRVQRQEREVMLKLKEVVDRQRDELRAKVQQLTTVSKEVEALQEQLERFMKMHGVRHKQDVLQAQLRSSVERKADMEADLKEKTKAIERLSARLSGSTPRTSSERDPDGLPSVPPVQSPPDSASHPEPVGGGAKDPDQPCFTKKEVRDIIFERNELKTNLFLVQEELSYYQREILNEE
uniref:Rab interacting lysosomal protein n=1 Tax=Tetraodon nigroviridis TaxID=99883 RepID=H3CCS3_TETNG